MRYGFVIDQNRCIGCHACTVACKEEHNVPVGVFRTWVKYIEKGTFPNVSRHFGVLRCNHCEDAPCIEICPTGALFRREDGIVDFDGSRCIGCKSCMQACPYDALYIDPASNTAAKCNFCAHRIEIGLQPACVIVCPTQAIIAGDLDDPASNTSTILATQKVTVRKPHKGTRPKLYYVGIEGDVLQPTMTTQAQSYLWADKQPGEDSLAPTGESLRLDGQKSTVVYDVGHPRPWGWKASAYLFTKSVAAGALMVAGIFYGLGVWRASPLLNIFAPAAALVFTALTCLLLIADLKRPERFFYLFTKSNWRSWLVIGAYILMAYGLAAFLWLVWGYFYSAVPSLLVLVAAVLGACGAGYTGFLFAQAKGRDLWQSPLFLWHLLVQAAIAGTSALIITSVLADPQQEIPALVAQSLEVALALSLLMVLGEVYLTPTSEDVKRAIDLLTSGRFRWRFWGGAILIGLVVPFILLLFGASGAASVPQAVAAALSLAGIAVFEDLWIKAGQAIPLS